MYIYIYIYIYKMYVCTEMNTSSRFKSSLPGRSRPNCMRRRVWASFVYLYHILFPIQSLLFARSSTVRGLPLSLDIITL